MPFARVGAEEFRSDIFFNLHTLQFFGSCFVQPLLKKVSQNGVYIRLHVNTCVSLLLTFMLLSPDSPQLSLGETDEENSTKPHVQLTLLPPSPALNHSCPLLLLLLIFPFPLSLCRKNGAPHSSTPPPFVTLSSPVLSHTTAFPSPQLRFTRFLPPLWLSLFSALCPCLALRVTSRMTGPWLEKS